MSPRLFLFLAFFIPAVALQADDRPNIILIMSDDMGWSDIGCYGGETQTPNLDALAKDGIRFTQFYNTGRCCPTRASLLTGLYAHQAGVGHMTGDYGLPQYQGELNRECVTIAEALKPAGYRTYMSGKWHVTPYRGDREDPDTSNWPRQRGFDRFYGTIHGAGSFFDPNSLTRGNKHITPDNDPEYKPDGTWYYTDAISDNAVRYIKDHAKNHGDTPFFQYVAYTAAHWPMHALPEDIAKYEGKFDDGYSPIREARIKRLKEMKLLPDHWKVTDQVGNWDDVKLKEWEAACMEVYAAMIDNMDQGIGRIVKALEETGEFDNTLIMFFQDNGGCAETFGRGKLVGPLERPAKPTLPPMGKDELQTQMVPPQSRDGYPLRRGDGVMPGPPETEIGYGKNWANVSNTPFREYKHWVHEGGVATPLIAHWPKGISQEGEAFRETKEGPLYDSPAHLIDLMATALDLGKAKYPADKIPVEGISLSPAFSGKALERGRPIFFEHEGNRAVRDGKWKLVAKGVKGAWELYDMEVDRTETNGLAAEKPEIAAKMAEQYDTWAEERGVVPFGSWRKSGANKGSNKKAFKVKPGDTFTEQTSPAVAGSSFEVKAKVSGLPADGVIVSQGGSNLGWSLYITGNKINFATRSGGKVVTATTELPKGEAQTLGARVLKKKIILTADDKKIGSLDCEPFLKGHPIDALLIGNDTGGTAGNYEPDWKFGGKIESVEILIK
ncbi:MAG: arylsulfatase [Verrucomicrobiales bacterium]|nr:arylsulfatase [Verrucomicrobiales bacterium]